MATWMAASSTKGGKGMSRHEDSARSWERWAIAGTPEEHRRLHQIEDAFDSFTIAHLDRLGVAEGWRCLEVGAGAGSIAAWMAGRAGARNVVATELQPEFARRAADVGVRVIRHDVTVDQPPGDGFDVIHARAVLEHIESRHDVVRRLAGWLAPGGWLLIEGVTFVPAIATRPVLARAEEALAELLAARVGTDLTWARNLPVPLERAGLTETSADLAGPVIDRK